MANIAEPGKWYIVVGCAGCGEPIPLAEVPSPDEKPELPYRTVTGVVCAQCGHTDTYAPALMSREQAPDAGGG